jgi:hypothetical protein
MDVDGEVGPGRMLARADAHAPVNLRSAKIQLRSRIPPSCRRFPSSDFRLPISESRSRTYFGGSEASVTFFM